jgi:hypothetical protein
MDTEGQQRFIALATLAVGIGTAIGITLTARGRTQELYPIAAAIAVSTAVVYSAYALGGDSPPRLRI